MRIIGYAVSVDRNRWVHLAPKEYFSTEEGAADYGRRHYQLLLEASGMTHVEGNPGIVYVKEILSVPTTLPYSYDANEPPTDKELLDIRYMEHSLDYNKAVLERYGDFDIDWSTVKEGERQAIQRRHQQMRLHPVLIMDGKMTTKTFNLGG